MCLYSAEVTEQGDFYIIEIPEREVTTAVMNEGDTYRVAMLTAQKTDQAKSTPQQGQSEPPVTEGDVVDLEIEDMGDQGDGIARIGPGYVVIVSDTDVGERIVAKITEARENVAFADAIKYYDR